MLSKESIQKQMEELKSEYGNWSFNIPLPFALWTNDELQLPHTRLKRIVQIVSDLSYKPLSECRILDLGCLDGMFSIEFAQQGAETIGVEIREANIKKAIFCKEVLGLQNLNFRQDDVRNISIKSDGKFDVIVCSGILYHLLAEDVINLIQTMFEMVSRVVVIDTHVALEPKKSILHDNNKYWGRTYREHSKSDTPAKKAKKLWASADNPESFWFTRPSLVNILSNTGFSSVYECFIPAHLNFGRPGIESKDRCTFVALKNESRQLKTSPKANSLKESWPERSLSYSRKGFIQDSFRLLCKKLQKKNFNLTTNNE